MTEKQQQPSFMRDITEPGWREREADRAAQFLAAVPMRVIGCAVRGVVAPGAMCSRYRVGGGCGFTGECQHKTGA